MWPADCRERHQSRLVISAAAIVRQWAARAPWQMRGSGRLGCLFSAKALVAAWRQFG